MELTEARQRHAELSEKLLDAQYRYHVLDAPTISDAEYDQGIRDAERDRGPVPRAAHARLGDAEGRRHDLDAVHARDPPGAAAQPGQRVLRTRSSAPGRTGPPSSAGPGPTCAS